MAEQGVSVDHATLNRWIVRYSPLIAEEAKKRKQPAAGSWRMDEIYIKVRGQWTSIPSHRYSYSEIICHNTVYDISTTIELLSNLVYGLGHVPVRLFHYLFTILELNIVDHKGQQIKSSNPLPALLCCF